MTGKEYLSQAYRLVENIESYTEEIKSLSDIVSNSGISERVQTSPTGDNIPKTVEKINEYKNKLEKSLSCLVALHNEINSVIEQVSDPDEKLLLRLKYINRKSWQEIADVMGYSERHVKRLHEKALLSVELLGEVSYEFTSKRN